MEAVEQIDARKGGMHPRNSCLGPGHSYTEQLTCGWSYQQCVTMDTSSALYAFGMPHLTSNTGWRGLAPLRSNIKRVVHNWWKFCSCELSHSAMRKQLQVKTSFMQNIDMNQP